MMRYSLRTLIVLLLILPPLGAWGWRGYAAYRERVEQAKAKQIWGDLTLSIHPGPVLVEEGDGPPEELKNTPIDQRTP